MSTPAQVQRPLVDLYSDTITLPTPEMRAFMAEAPLGDEQKGEDPSVNELTAMAAELLGKEAAVFLPSGTMCNEIALAVHSRPGDEVLTDRTAHIINYEVGGPAALSGINVRALDGERGVFTAEQFRAAIRPASRYAPVTSGVVIEQTSNAGGGTIWPLERIEEITAIARDHGMWAHMDGARLLNASVASGIEPRVYAAHFDSVFVDLSKGLGAPVGGILAGTQDFIDQAWRLKQRWGGAMRQAGVIASAGVYALRNHVSRLAEDHENARALAASLAAIEGLEIRPEHVDTNIVLFDVAATGLTAAEFGKRTHERFGVRVSVFGPTTVRVVTHIDVTAAQIPVAVRAIAAVTGEALAGR
ncbi:threonine aldolase [Streptomyces eurocidicus]|uniref:Threonine aldolase n=1 Tax=Streptomyces eurocidicus TaxID=66423 RepID=A0A2N8NX08_STREU|nr:threonine aldolase family protein [Streptomyces eurocidicus]MBB5117905.1 threonine aldolase [Streptomyces eurocidicus]PNE33282.1 threonine aldolase [Streptomyces eurocidicus]